MSDALYRFEEGALVAFPHRANRASRRATIRSNSRSPKRTRAGSSCTRGSILFAPLRTRRRRSHRTHVAKEHPEWVRRYGAQLWVDPGEPAARDYVLSVIIDLVRRYDIDGVHIDDYFYPYPVKGRRLFPDDATWERFGRRAG